MADLFSAPLTPEMPVSAEDNPDYYSSCMRLLYLASAMKSFDVVVLMAATDEDNVKLFSLLGDMRPVLEYVTRRKNEIEGRPQVVVPMLNEARQAEFAQVAVEKGQAPPLVIPRRLALPSLVCEVLHPDAHWSGSLERVAGDDGESADERRDRDAFSLEEGQSSPSPEGREDRRWHRAREPPLARSPSAESQVSQDEPSPLFGIFHRRSSPAGISSPKPMLQKRPPSR